MPTDQHDTFTPKVAARVVTFQHPFVLPRDTSVQQPGSYEVRSEAEPLDVVWGATLFRYALIVRSGGLMQSFALTLDELDELLALDKQISAEAISGGSAS